jgi:hypothetical protein
LRGCGDVEKGVPVMETVHSILFAYPAFSGFIVAGIVLVAVLRIIRWWEDRKTAVADAASRRAWRSF